jgi:hypothetical protein
MKKILMQLEKRQRAIAKVRDKLREDIAEAAQLEEDCTEAYENLSLAIDALSRMQ